MHVEGAERLPALHDEVAGLDRVVSRFRRRLGLERLVAFGLRGLMASALAVIGLSVVTWLIAGADSVVGNRDWLVVAPLLAALALALVRWPSPREAALAADTRLELDERLATALELAQHARAGRFDRLQIRDAVARATEAPRGRLVLDRGARNEALLSALLLVLAGASLVLPGLPRPSLPSADQPLAVAPDAALTDLPARALPPDAADLATSPAAKVDPQAAGQADPDLAARVQQEQAERDALDKLTQALSRVSAAKPAADALQRGDFSAAQQQLSSLGDEADQLSDAAKQQLSKALQSAANTTAAGDRQLADRERQAAQALSRSTYAEQRQALHNLGDQVVRSGQRSVSADQLARDQGQLQQVQQQAGRDPSAQAAGQQSAPALGTAKPSALGQGAAEPPSTSAASKSQSASASAEGAPAGDQAPGAGGGQGEGQGGQQGGTGTGTGSDAQPLGDQPSRLDSAGQSVVVPTKLGNGPGVRPPDGTEDQTGATPSNGGKSVAELVQAQQTGQVAPEQNLVPGEQRPVVRGYFR